MKNQFKDNGDGTITDSMTGLMWQKEISQKRCTWKDAMKYCKDLKLAGYTDWRLPDIDELSSIIDRTKYSPAIDAVYFPDTKSEECWSSSPYAPCTNYVWYVNFSNGIVLNSSKDYGYYVRCVRGTQRRLV